jgi:hypothetical protein
MTRPAPEGVTNYGSLSTRGTDGRWQGGRNSMDLNDLKGATEHDHD